MSKIRLSGSNSGYVEIAAAADAGNLTFVLPTTGTSLFGNGNNVITGITTFSAALDINSSIDVSGASVLNGTTTFNNDVTFDGATAGYDAVWDRSDNQLEFADNAKISMGSGGDLQIYHSGSGSAILNNNNHQLTISSDNALNLTSRTGQEYFFRAYPNNRVELYYDYSSHNTPKLQTSATGVVVTGICTATSFSGSSVGLTYDSPLSHRNFLINGSTIVWQRGTVNPNVSNYGCDRWWFANNATRVDRSTTTPDGFAYSMKVTSSGGTTSIGQAIELIDTGRSQFEPFTKPYTLSFYARTDSGTNDISANVYYRNSKFSSTNQTNWNGSAGNNSTWDMGTMTTTWQRFSKTFTTGGNPNANNQILGIEMNCSATYYITGVQFEKGAVATPFEHRSFGEELIRCHRYYQVIAPPVAEALIGDTLDYDNTTYFTVDLSIPMRANPSLVVSSFSNAFRLYGTNPRNVSTLAHNTGSASKSRMHLYANGGSSGAVGFARVFSAASNGGVYATIAASAEL